jgi:hypothetical protein
MADPKTLAVSTIPGKMRADQPFSFEIVERND